MCGIAFIYSSQLSSDELKKRMGHALQSIIHRGPDEFGTKQSPGWITGQRRLSIIDIQKSQQPMSDPSGRFFLSYNGEIYNYKSLKEKLASKWKFRTDGDTEVVLAGFILEGASFFEKLSGMWALALWDNQKKQLLLSRDRIGKKPLYYSLLGASDSGIACASELNVIFKLSFCSKKEDIHSAADYLRYGYYLPGKTIYQDILEVLPGHYLKWSAHKKQIENSPYWRMNVNPFCGSKRQAENMLKENLIQAVKKRLVSDVEVGAFLSGGIDSSIVVGILGKYLGLSPKTFSIGFIDKGFDERKYARIVGEKYCTDHYEKIVKVDDSNELINLVLGHVGQPFADSSLLPSALVAKLAASKVKVALSGDGADELFSGYNRYKARMIMRWYTRLPAGIRHNLEAVTNELQKIPFSFSRQVIKNANLFMDIGKRVMDETPYTAPLLYSKNDFKRMLPDIYKMGHKPVNLPEMTHLDDIHTMMAKDTLIYLPQNNLLKVDRTSMASSLEVRSPFIDHKIVELALSFPRSWHRKGFQGKQMLKKSFQHLLPEQIWNRKKQGFAVPVHAWFRQGLEIQLEDLLRNTITYINTDFVLQMLREHTAFTHDHGYRLWNIFIFLMWKQSYRNSQP